MLILSVCRLFMGSLLRYAQSVVFRRSGAALRLHHSTEPPMPNLNRRHEEGHKIDNLKEKSWDWIEPRQGHQEIKTS